MQEAIVWRFTVGSLVGGVLLGVCVNIVAGLQKKPQIPQHLQRCGIMLQAKEII